MVVEQCCGDWPASERREDVTSCKLHATSFKLQATRYYKLQVTGSERHEDALDHDAAALQEMRLSNQSLGHLKEISRLEPRGACSL